MEKNMIFEINTGARAKEWKKVPPWILNYIASKGGAVIINSDCHKAEFLDFAFDVALFLTKEYDVRLLLQPHIQPV